MGTMLVRGIEFIGNSCASHGDSCAHNNGYFTFSDF